MLQIGSGKLFRQGVLRRNELRGVLYSNLSIARDTPIETAAGRLLPTSTLRDSQSIVYEYIEHIEGEAIAPGVLASHGMDPFLSDFAVVLSFALLVTCTPDVELARRLTGDRQGLSVKVAPKKLIKRVFDTQVWCQEREAAYLVTFVSALIGLPRKIFLSVMRAIRTYVTALHRLGDDAELAYTLFVASIESLAQAFDGHRAEWRDYEEEKRRAVDTALLEAPEDVSNRVRAALLEIEHVSLGRRFRNFALAHIEPAYFRSEAADQEHPIGRSELPDVLRQAYQLRSGYVHNLDELPKILTLGHSFAETARVGRTTFLTFQGLSRLARHVITTFIFRQPQIAVEPYDYHLEQSGTVQMQPAAEYWIWQTQGLTAAHGRSRLEGFFEQLAPLLDASPDAKLTDLGPLLAVVEPMLPKMKVGERLPFLALYFLFNWLVPPPQRSPNLEDVWNRYKAELSAPSVESLLIHLVQQRMPAWPIDDHRQMHDDYFRRRDRRKGLRIARSLEARLTLMLAERYRANGDRAAARLLVSFAVENQPGRKTLQELETAFNPDQPIDWRDEYTRQAAAKAGDEPPPQKE